MMMPTGDFQSGASDTGTFDQFDPFYSRIIIQEKNFVNTVLGKVFRHAE